jgi:SAM-dependent methyltransferase
MRTILRHCLVMSSGLVVECLDWLPTTRWPKHPMDKKLGIETSKRFIRQLQLSRHRNLEAQAIMPISVQPSVVRRALDCLNVHDDMIFIDIGCGRGRALIVASEFPFRALYGYELLPYIVNIARRNVAKVNLSERVVVVEADASQPALPEDGEVVLFLYNPFHDDVVTSFITYLEAYLGKVNRHAKLWIVYVNPVCAAQFDGCRIIRRYAAEKVHFDDEEREFTHSKHPYESFVIWQSQPFSPALAGADAPVKVTVPKYGAEVLLP